MMKRSTNIKDKNQCIGYGISRVTLFLVNVRAKYLDNKPVIGQIAFKRGVSREESLSKLHRKKTNVIETVYRERSFSS